MTTTTRRPASHSFLVEIILCLALGALLALTLVFGFDSTNHFGALDRLGAEPQRMSPASGTSSDSDSGSKPGRSAP